MLLEYAQKRNFSSFLNANRKFQTWFKHNDQYCQLQHPREIMAAPVIPWSVVGRSGVCCWPARGSDLTPFGFYLWSRLEALFNVEDRVLYITGKLFVDVRDVFVPDTNRVGRLEMSSASVHPSYWWTH